MATSKSAEKRARQNRKRRAHNNSWKTRFRNARRDLDEAIDAEEDEETVQELARKATGIADKMASRDIIHENKAARWKSRVQKKADQYLE